MRRQLLANGALLALALGTLGVVWATRETPTTSELSSRKDKLLPTFQKDAVARLVLSKDGQELVVEQARDDGAGEYQIKKPWPERADIGTVNQLLGSLDSASALRPADGVSDEQAGLGVRALEISLEMSGKSQTLKLGGPAPAPPSARYAEVTHDGVSKRYVVSQRVASELDVPFDKFREPRLFEYGRSELDHIGLGAGAVHIELDLGEHDAFFTLVSGEHELANRDVVERILAALARLSTSQFVDADAARTLLNGQGNSVTVGLRDKAIASVTLRFGDSCPKDPAQALVLREQAGRAARAGCIPKEVADALRATADEIRLRGPFSARTDEIEELRVTYGARKLELSRKDKAFVLRFPGPSDVPLDAGNALISAIVDARGERAPSADLIKLGLGEPVGKLSIQIAGADEASHRSEEVLIGKPRLDGSVCAQRQADHVVVCFGAETARAFDPDPTLLKGLALLSFAPSELTSFSIAGPDLDESIERHDDGSYELQKPKGFTHDGSLVSDAVQTLGTLQAASWVAASDAPRFGLATPKLHVTFTLGSAPARELFIGAAATGGFFARLTPDPAIFVLSRSVFTQLATPLIDRSLAPFSEAVLASIDVEVGGHKTALVRHDAAWVGAPQRATDTVPALTALRAEFTVHLGPAKATEGFGKPRLTVSFADTHGKRVRLLVGAADTLDDSSIRYARLDNVDATFALSQRVVTDLEDAFHE